MPDTSGGAVNRPVPASEDGTIMQNGLVAWTRRTPTRLPPGWVSAPSATVAAAVSTAAAAAAVSTAAAAAAATAAILSGRTRFSLAHRQGAAVDILAIQGGNGRIRNVLIIDGHEGEAAATAGFAIHDNLGAVDLTVAGKHGSK
jgi:hypothetical protein